MRIILGVFRDILADLGDQLDFGTLKMMVSANNQKPAMSRKSLNEVFQQYAAKVRCNVSTVRRLWLRGNANLDKVRMKGDRPVYKDKVFKAMAHTKWELDGETKQAIMKPPETYEWFDKLLNGYLTRQAGLYFYDMDIQRWQEHMWEWFYRLTETDPDRLKQTVLNHWYRESQKFRKHYEDKSTVSLEEGMRGRKTRLDDDDAVALADVVDEKVVRSRMKTRAEEKCEHLGYVKWKGIRGLSELMIEDLAHDIADWLVQRNAIPANEHDKLMSFVVSDIMGTGSPTSGYDFDAVFKTSPRMALEEYARRWKKLDVVRNLLHEYNEVKEWL